MMKREYVKPVFYAEEYVVTNSIAACEFTDVNEPLTINYGDNVCGHGIDGHVWGGQNGKSGTIGNVNNGVLTLFNDGADKDACLYDWGGPNNNVVTGPDGESYGSFAQAFYGNSADVGNHSPGYMGQSFFS